MIAVQLLMAALAVETAVLQQEIDEAHHAGGGVVHVSCGKHLVGGLELKSNVELNLEEGAELVFSDDAEDYLPARRVSWEGVECWNYSPLIYAYGATNIAITGSGKLVARHERWKKWDRSRTPEAQKVWDKLVYEWGEKDVPVEKRQLLRDAGAAFRPHFIHFNRCRDVRLDGFTIRGSPFWTLHFYLCERATVRNLDISAYDEDGYAMANSDGIDIESSKNVTVEHCSFCQNDDGVVIKSGRNRDGRRVGVASENILVRDCVVHKGHGLLVIGSELSGGIRNVTMENCRMDGVARRLLYIKTARPRGGFVEGVTMRNVTANEVEGEMLAINASYMISPSEVQPTGVGPTRITGVRMENVTAEKTGRLYSIEGDPEAPVSDVVLVKLSARETGSEPTAENVRGMCVDGTRMPDVLGCRFKNPHW